MSYRDPKPEELKDPTFEAIWQEIKSWDVNVPAEYNGYCGTTGNHVCAILDAIHSVHITTPTDEAKKLVAEALECTMLCDDTSKYRHPEEHFKSCPAHHRPVVESLVTRLLADRDNWKLAQEVMRDGRDNLQIERDGLLADNERLREALREIVKGVDDWNKAVSKVIQIEEPHVWPGLEHARALIEKASHQP